MAAAEKSDQQASIALWLEIDLESEPISGTIREGDEAPKPFVGWLGLTSVLEALRRKDVGTRPSGALGRPEEQALTMAERDIVELVCEGLTNPQIAERLSVSPRTIQGHLLKVFKKLDVSTRAELVARILLAPRPTDAIDRRERTRGNAPYGAQGSDAAPEIVTTRGQRRNSR